jgi:hypothetical protein
MDFGSLGFTSNPYLEQQVQDSLGDTTRAYNMTAQPAFNAAMVNSGSFGNSGVQQMNQEAQRQLQTSLGRQANDMRSNNLWQGLGFDANNYWQNQNFDRGVYNDAFAQNQQQYQNGLGLLGMMNGANQQSLGMGQQIQDAPMNYFNNFNQQANSVGQGYGTSTGTMSATGSPLLGALGGAQLGGAMARAWGGGNTNTGTAWSNNWGAAMNGTGGANGNDVAYG